MSEKITSTNDNEIHKVSIKKELGALKNKIERVKSRTLLITMLASVSGLCSRANELGVDINLSELLLLAESKVKTYENTLAQDKNRQEIEEKERLKEALAEVAKEVNAKREIELQKHIAEYISEPFQKKFSDLLKEENDLLKKAANDTHSLTTKEKNQLLGKYDSVEEKEEFQKKQQELNKCWRKHYIIKEIARQAIQYRQSQINANDEIINNPNAHEDIKVACYCDNKVHEQKITEHQQDLKILAPKEQEREEARQALLALVNSNQPELAIAKLKAHHEVHWEEYEEARAQDPNHQGYHELNHMITKLGGHEKLGLAKPTHSVYQLIESSKDKRDSSIDHSVANASKKIAKALIDKLQQQKPLTKKAGSLDNEESAQVKEGGRHHRTSSWKKRSATKNSR